MNQNIEKRRYLVCVDGKQECRVALRLACMKAKYRGGHITILHVVPPSDFQTLGSIADRMRMERLNEGEALLSELSKEAKENFDISPTLLLLEGNEGEKIIETAMSDPSIVILVLGITHEQHTHANKLSAWLAAQINNTLFVPTLFVPGSLTDDQLKNLI